MPRSESFHTTRWTHVLAAKGDSRESRAALSDLCEAYYSPVHAFIRHTTHGMPDDQLRDLTHEFFARLLKNPGLDLLERGRGKFRSYLLGAVKHFLSDQQKFRQAAKRGGNDETVSLDEAEAVSDRSTSTESFDRDWALSLVDRATDRLAAEHSEAGKVATFEALKPWLNGNAAPVSQAEVAGQLEMSEGAVKVAIHRLRQRFRHVVRSEIRETVDSDDEIAKELNYLINVLAGP